MQAAVTITERRAVEIDEREAARIAGEVIRARFQLGAATEISLAGRLRSWARDDHGKPEPIDGDIATPDQRAALAIARKLVGNTEATNAGLSKT